MTENETKVSFFPYHSSFFLKHIHEDLYLFQTPFVRQNTPHPKELKAKAHKLFSKGKNDSRSASTEEQVILQKKLKISVSETLL